MIFKKNKIITKFSFCALLIIGLLSGCNKDSVEVTTLTRNVDKLSFPYQESTQTFTVRTNKDWKVSSEVDWISLSPGEGVGDGSSYQYVTVVAQHNKGIQREGIIYLTSEGKSLEIVARQEAGLFELGKPMLTGQIHVGTVVRALINIPYLKSSGEEDIRVVTQLSGDGSDGIEVPVYETTIEQAGDGSLSVPFTGSPIEIGDLMLNVKVYVNGELKREENILSEVIDESVVLSMSASKFKWGGHYLENLKGYKSSRTNAITVEDDNEANYSQYIVECAFGDAGTVDLFTANQPGLVTFRNARGLTGWTGSKVYEHPGYVKIGTGSLGGWIQTPALSALQGTSDVTVEFEFFRWSGDSKGVKLSAVDGGSAVGGELSVTTKEWIKMSVVIKDATPTTKIRWSADDLATSGSRFTLRNIVIKK